MLKKCLRAIAGFLLVVLCVNTLSAACLDGCDTFRGTADIHVVDPDCSDCADKNAPDHHHDDGIAHHTGHCCHGHCPMMPTKEFVVLKRIDGQKSYSTHLDFALSVALKSPDRPPKSYSIV